MRDQPTLLRQWSLLRSLSARRHGATLRELARDAGVSTKTILRDLDLLRTLGFPLVDEVFDHGRKHWKLSTAAGLLQLSFTVEEAAALYLGRQFLEPLAGTYFFHGAQSAFAKIRATLGDAPLRHLEKLAAAFYHKTHGLTDYSAQGQLIDDLVRAIEDRRLNVISYQSLRATEPVTYYDLRPYALVWHHHALYLLGWSTGHGQVRTFKVDRLSAVEVKELQFDPPADFDPQALLAGSFGIFASEGPPLSVTIRFSPTVARTLSERTHHPTQRLAPQPDGSLLAHFELSRFEELTAWILSWGQHAEVLAPPALRAHLRTTLAAALGQYQEPGDRGQESGIRSQESGDEPEIHQPDAPARDSPATRRVSEGLPLPMGEGRGEGPRRPSKTKPTNGKPKHTRKPPRPK